MLKDTQRSKMSKVLGVLDTRQYKNYKNIIKETMIIENKN